MSSNTINIFETFEKIKNEINEHIKNSSFNDDENNKLDLAVCVVKYCHTKLFNDELDDIQTFIYDQIIEELFEKALDNGQDYFKDFCKNIVNGGVLPDNFEECIEDILPEYISPYSNTISVDA